MVSKTYGIFDAVTGEYVRTFVASNDYEAKRAAQYIVREKGFDDIAGKDRSVHYLYSLNTENGLIVDNEIRLICNLATYIEERKQEEIHNSLSMKLANDDFVKEIKDELLVYLKGELKDVCSKANESN